MIADIEGDYTDLNAFQLPNEMPILAVRNIVMFPGIVSPILIGRVTSLHLVEEAEKHNKLIGVVCQIKPDTDFPEQKDLYEYGVCARIVRMITLPNDGHHPGTGTNQVGSHYCPQALPEGTRCIDARIRA